MQRDCDRYTVTHKSQQKSSEHQKTSKQVYLAGYQINQQNARLICKLFCEDLNAGWGLFNCEKMTLSEEFYRSITEVSQVNTVRFL